MGSSQPLRIGVFIEKVQLSDVTGIDLIGNCSTEYVKVAATMGFAHLLPHAIDMEFLYISSTLDPTHMTPSMSVKPTHTYETAPVDLDILVVGGPPFDMRPQASLEYLKKADGRAKVIMSTCVGALWLADAGILKGKSCTTNRFAVPVARQMHPETEWLDQRWVVDESGKTKYWTAGGAGAGKMVCGSDRGSCADIAT